MFLLIRIYVKIKFGLHLADSNRIHKASVWSLNDYDYCPRVRSGLRLQNSSSSKVSRETKPKLLKKVALLVATSKKDAPPHVAQAILLTIGFTSSEIDELYDHSAELIQAYRRSKAQTVLIVVVGATILSALSYSAVALVTWSTGQPVNADSTIFGLSLAGWIAGLAAFSSTWLLDLHQECYIRERLAPDRMNRRRLPGNRCLEVLARIASNS